MAKVAVTPRALKYMSARSSNYTLYRFPGIAGCCGGHIENALSEGKPKSMENYTFRIFNGITVYISDSLLNEQITIDLTGFLFWKWLTLR